MVRARYILRFATINERNSHSLVGESVVKLAELANAGFPVPPAFVVTGIAFEEFVTRGGLLKARREWSEKIHNCREEDKENLLNEIKVNISGTSLPALIEADLRDAFEEIVGEGEEVLLKCCFEGTDGDDICKVARAKDPDSFVGIVRECWAEILLKEFCNASLSRAISDKLTRYPLLLCIKSFPAISRGMAYSAEPTVGDRQKLVIHAWKGDEFSGDPSEVFIVDRNNLTVMERKCGPSGPSGIAESFAKELARLTERIESHFRLPQKIEWVFSGERFYVLSVGKLPIKAEKISTVWSGLGPIELPSYRLAPLSENLLFLCLEKASGKEGREKSLVNLSDEKLVELINGHFYWNLSAIAGILSRLPLLDPWLVPAFKGTPIELELFSKDAKKSFNFANNALALIKFAKVVKKCLKNYEGAEEFFSEKGDEFLRADIKGKPDASLYLLFDQLVENFSLFLKAEMEIGLAANALFYLLVSILYHFAISSNDGGKFQKSLRMVVSFLSDMGCNSAFAMLNEMQKLAQLAIACEICEYLKARKTYNDFNGMLRRDEGGDVFLKRLEAFLSTYRHRCVGEKELSLPRWGEDAEEVYRWLEKIIEDNEKTEDKPIAQMTTGYSNKESPIQLPYFVHRVFNWARKNLILAANLLVESNDLSAKGFLCFRVLALECGRRFFSRQLLESAEDIFYLTYEEIQKLLSMAVIPAVELKSLVTQRKEEYYRNKIKIAPTFIVGESYRDEGDNEETLFEPEAESFAGIGISSGSCAGKVRILADLQSVITIKQGEIAIAVDSGSWLLPTLLFARAVVTEDSAFLSECVITAQRMKIPFISSVRNITKSIATNKSWFVDADQGSINLVKEEVGMEPTE